MNREFPDISCSKILPDLCVLCRQMIVRSTCDIGTLGTSEESFLWSRPVAAVLSR
jgi:hypothetical protein